MDINNFDATYPDDENYAKATSYPKESFIVVVRATKYGDSVSRQIVKYVVQTKLGIDLDYSFEALSVVRESDEE